MVKQLIAGEGYVSRKAREHGAKLGEDYTQAPVPGRPGAVVLHGTTLVGQLFLSLLVVGAG